MKKKLFLVLLFAFIWTLDTGHLTLAFAQEAIFKNPCVGKAEKWIYRANEKNGPWIKTTDIATYKNVAGKAEMTVVSKVNKSSYATTMVMVPETMKPIKVIVKGDTDLVCEAIYTGPYIAIRYKTFDKKKPIRTKKISNTPVTYDQATLFWLLRGYPFNKPEEMQIDLVMPLGNRCSMKVRYLGKETVIVPEGKFNAHKLEVEPDALLPFFSKDLKTFFWYSDEKIPKFLKYEYPRGQQVTELIETKN